MRWDLGLAIPATATEAGMRFFDTWARVNSLVPAVFGNAHKLTSVTRKLLDSIVALPGPNERLKAIVDEEAAKRSPEEKEEWANGYVDPVSLLNAHAQLLWEMVFCRQVDNFLSYLSSLLYAAFMKRPEMLKEKGKTIDWATVLSQATIGDIASAGRSCRCGTAATVRAGETLNAVRVYGGSLR